MHLLTLFMEVKTNQERNIWDRKMHLFTLFMEVILIRILEKGIHLFPLFMEVKTNKDKKIRDRDASLNSFRRIED